MNRNKQKPRFAPLPARALRDLRLGAMHLRTLGIIAAFDRMGKNGSGCWTSQSKIAAIIGIDKTRLSHSLRDLRNYGYITSEMNPNKRWFRVHRVIYTDADYDCLGAGKSVALGSNISCGPLLQIAAKSMACKNMTIVPTIAKL